MIRRAGSAALDRLGIGGVGQIAGGGAFGLGLELDVEAGDARAGIAAAEVAAALGTGLAAQVLGVTVWLGVAAVLAEDIGVGQFGRLVHTVPPRTESRPLVRRWRFGRQRSNTSADGCRACVSRRCRPE